MLHVSLMNIQVLGRDTDATVVKDSSEYTFVAVSGTKFMFVVKKPRTKDNGGNTIAFMFQLF